MSLFGKDKKLFLPWDSLEEDATLTLVSFTITFELFEAQKKREAEAIEGDLFLCLFL